MDAITQIQGYISSIPKLMVSNVEQLSCGKLSVGQAHALAQLSETGFIGVRGVTSVSTPVPLKSLDSFRQTADDAIQAANVIMYKVAQLDALLASLPESFETIEEKKKELEELTIVYQECVERLRVAENRAEYYQKLLQNAVTDVADTNYNIKSKLELDDILP